MTPTPRTTPGVVVYVYHPEREGCQCRAMMAPPGTTPETIERWRKAWRHEAYQRQDAGLRPSGKDFAEWALHRSLLRETTDEEAPFFDNDGGPILTVRPTGMAPLADDEPRWEDER